VITAIDVENIYEIPLRFHQEKLEQLIIKKLNLKCDSLSIDEWEEMVYRIKHPKDRVDIAFVGKYTRLKESYKSLTEAFVHAGAKLNLRVNLNWVDAEKINPSKVDHRSVLRCKLDKPLFLSLSDRDMHPGALFPLFHSSHLFQ